MLRLQDSETSLNGMFAIRVSPTALEIGAYFGLVVCFFRSFFFQPVTRDSSMRYLYAQCVDFLFLHLSAPGRASRKITTFAPFTWRRRERGAIESC